MNPKDAEAIARILMRRWLGRGWRVAWTHRAGIYAECDAADKCIVLSRKATAQSSITEFADTLAHEIAHALAATKGHHGHGRLWKQLARALGARTGRRE